MTNIETRRSRVTGNQLSVGRAEAFGLDPEGQRWIASCDDHGTIVGCDTKAQAMSSTGLDFCEDCRAEQATDESHLSDLNECFCETCTDRAAWAAQDA
jgi:hypothetical protein